MPKPLPWSHTALEDFVNCPRAYHRKRVVKDVKEAESEALIWGSRVHKSFEDRQGKGIALPGDLVHHEPFMKKLEDLPGLTQVEMRIALNRKLEPCMFFGEDVWFRGVIDWAKIRGDTAHVIDYKTGKPHSKFNQLKLFALHILSAFQAVNHVHVSYYWTQTCKTTGEVYRRDQIKELWAPFTPNLRQYAEAFKTDTWQPRPSGLCNGWCPVIDCEHWKPRRGK